MVTALLPGCSTTLSTRQTARTLDPGHFEVEAGAGVLLPLGTVRSVIGLGESQTAKLLAAVFSMTPYTVTDADKQDLTAAAVALAVMPPLPVAEAGLRYGVLEDLDVGLRYSVSALRVDGKYRFWEQVSGEGRADAAVGLGVSRYLFKNPAFEVLEFVRMDDFSRWDVEVPVYVSREWGEWARVYGAVKYLYSRTEVDQSLVATAEQATVLSGIDFRLDDVVHTHFLGASGGVKLGYRHAFLVLELTAGYAFGSVRVLGAERSLGGLTLYPSAGLDLRF